MSYYRAFRWWWKPTQLLLSYGLVSLENPKILLLSPWEILESILLLFFTELLQADDDVWTENQGGDCHRSEVLEAGL